MALLVVERGKDRGHALAVVPGKPVTVGRERSCELPIRDVMVSRRHFQVRAEAGRFVVRDLRSSNGTFLNGRRLAPETDAPLELEDKVEIGSTLFSLVPDEAAGSAGHRGELSGRSLGGYRLEERLGRGGMGTVYKALQLSLDRTVALKVLARDLTSDPRRVEMFLSEARAAGKLNHPNIVQVYDVGACDGLYFFSMEYMERGSLEEILGKEGRLLVPRALKIAIDAAKGLDFAERSRIVHRDVKPANIMVNAEGVAKIGDLGIARAATARAPTAGLPAVGEGPGDGAPLGTATPHAGMATHVENDELVAGSPLYMAPEQARGGEIDHRADLYSLGATLFNVLAGEPPFSGASPREVILKHLNEPARALSTIDPKIPAEVSALVARLLEKSPADRFPGAGALLEVLRPLALRHPEGWSPEAEAAAPAGSEGADSGAPGWLARLRAMPRPAIVAIVCLLLLGGLRVGCNIERERARVQLARERAEAKEKERLAHARKLEEEAAHRRAEKKREDDARQALDEANGYATKHVGDDLPGVRDRYTAVATMFPGTAAASEARAQAENASSTAETLAASSRKRAEAEAAADAELRPLLAALATAPPGDLEGLRLRTGEALARHGEAQVAKSAAVEARKTFDARLDQLTQQLDAESRAAVERGAYAEARAALDRAAEWGIADLKTYLTQKRRSVTAAEGAARASEAAARERAHEEEVARLDAADDPAKRAALQFQELLRALEAARKKGLDFDDTRARADRRIFALKAEEQLKQKLVLHIQKGGQPQISSSLPGGVVGTAVAVDADGLTFQAHPPGGGLIEQRKAFTALTKDDVAHFFGALPNLSPVDRFAFAGLLTDRGDVERARKELDRAARDDPELRERVAAAEVELGKGAPRDD